MEIAGGEGSKHSDAELTLAIVALAKQKGVHLTFTYFEPVLRFIPPLTLTRKEVDFAISVLDEAMKEAVRPGLSLEELLPANRYTRSYVQSQRGKLNLRRFLSRLYETSPERWFKKIGEMASK
jgi:hypothetical protein